MRSLSLIYLCSNRPIYTQINLFRGLQGGRVRWGLANRLASHFMLCPLNFKLNVPDDAIYKSRQNKNIIARSKSKLQPRTYNYYQQAQYKLLLTYISVQLLRYFMNIPNLRFVTKHFINGKFVEGIKGQTFELINPATEEIFAKVHKGTAEDIDLAVAAAREAFDNGPWGRMDPTDRARCLFKLADLIERDADDLAKIQALNNGKPYGLAKALDVDLTHKIFRYYGGWVDKIKGNTISMDGPFSLSTRKEPVGVAGQIIPWNVPLIMLAYKMAPALAAGCTLVLKTAENTPLSALRVAQLVQEAGIPAGVVNIVSGFGDIGAHLARHRGIDKVAFTGSLKVGKDIMQNCHQHNLKRVTLELGGKSANIITKNADLQKAVCAATWGTFFNAGQVCIAGTRVFVHSSLYDQFVKMSAERASKIKLGHCFDPQAEQGPQINQKQMEKVLGYIKKGVEEGARIETGGKRRGNKGYFIQPTVFTNVKDDMVIAREEIFGPVQCIFKFEDNDEVIRRANDSQYGLGAGVITQNVQQAEYFARRLRAGTVFKNCFSVFGPTAPFGGFKNSGIGREMGEQGVNGYLQLKTIIERL